MREINTEKKKRWVSLYVENRIGVLARISGMMSGKSYNISSITVGVTEDPTVSRMTIGLSSDDATFEQIKKQLNRCVEVIKLNDITDAPTHMKEILFVKIHLRRVRFSVSHRYLELKRLITVLTVFF